MTTLLNEAQLTERILGHIDNKTTDLGSHVWREPTENYLSQKRFEQEVTLLKRLPVPFCPSALLTETGSFVARKAAGTPILVVRGQDSQIRAFVNVCRHRGMPVAEGSGCRKSFVCPYHSWTYALDGTLKNIADSHGFPGVDAEEHGLLPVGVAEKGGLVFVNQEGPIMPEDIAQVPDFFSEKQTCFEQESMVDQTNWKLLAETTMEGYHIKGLHRKSFFPYGLDNTNVVETFGPNSRVVFPFKRINKLRDIAPAERSLDGMVTSVYNLFPNTVVSVLSKHSTLTIFEPIAADKTEIVIYRVANQLADGNCVRTEEAKLDANFVKGAGFDEDREAAVKIHDAIRPEKNTHLTFGLFEKAIVHFHESLKNHLEGL